MGLWSDRSYLRLCERLSTCGVRPGFVEGERIARGFADLGFEEFCMLPTGKMVSLFSGKTSIISREDEHFFFLVPTVDDLIHLLAARNIECRAVRFRDQRTWEIELASTRGEFAGGAPSLEEALIQGMLGALVAERGEG